MNIKDIIILLILLVLITGAIRKIIRDKKKGVMCSGCSNCPVSGSCGSSLKVPE